MDWTFALKRQHVCQGDILQDISTPGDFHVIFRPIIALHEHISVVFVRCSKIEQNTKNIDLPIFKNPISVICGSGIFFSSKKSQVLMNSQTNN